MISDIILVRDLVLGNKFGLYYKLLYFRCSKAKIDHETP